MNKKIYIGIGIVLLLVVIYFVYHRFFSQQALINRAKIISHDEDSKTVVLNIGNEKVTHNYANEDIATMIPKCDCSVELASSNESSPQESAYGVHIMIDGVVYNTLSW